VPVFIPRRRRSGIDMVHFGVVVVVNIMIGLITPPYGMLLFVMQSITQAPLRHIVRDLLPFLGALLRGARHHHLRAGRRALAAAAVRLPGVTITSSRKQTP
jgi:hypothetical protein